MKYTVDCVIRIKHTLDIEVSEKELSKYREINKETGPYGLSAYDHVAYEDIAAMKAIQDIRSSDWWQESLGTSPNNTFELSKPKLKTTTHQWQFLQKPHQLAMNERVCQCGAHVRGPNCVSNEGECPIKYPCNCKREDCPSVKGT